MNVHGIAKRIEKKRACTHVFVVGQSLVSQHISEQPTTVNLLSVAHKNRFYAVIIVYSKKCINRSGLSDVHMHTHRQTSASVVRIVERLGQCNDSSGGGHWNKADPAHTLVSCV